MELTLKERELINKLKYKDKLVNEAILQKNELYYKLLNRGEIEVYDKKNRNNTRTEYKTLWQE